MLQQTLSGAFRFFRVAGITVYVHWSWFLLVLFEFESRSGMKQQYGSRAWLAAEILAVFAIVLVHEFGHALACRSVGGQADTIILWPLGGVAFVRPPMRPGAMLWSIAAGPLVNVALVPITIAAALLSTGAPQDLNHFLVRMAFINAGILVFNILPVYPLDGGQIVQSILWFFLGFSRSLRIASVFGVITAVIVGALALWAAKYWLVVMAAFIGWQSVVGFRVAKATVGRTDLD